MRPKKKSSIEPVIYGICLICVLYVALHAAAVYEHIKYMVETGSIEKSSQSINFINELSNRIAYEPTKFVITQYTKKFLMYGAFGWLIVILAIENSRKNYIHGKEFGTSKWGTLEDIRDLFAENIMKEEIKNARQIKYFLGRWKVKNNLYKECERDGKLLEKMKLERLSEIEKVQRDEGIYNKHLHAESVEGIKREVKDTVALAKREAWKPNQLQSEFESRLSEIKESPLYDNAERKQQEEKAKCEYERKLKEFYSSGKKIERIKEKYKNADMLLTKTERISFYNYKLNQNTLILGGSGSGKTRGYVLPNILQAHSSYICTDPKGEILEKTGYFLSEIMGYKIRVLNLDDKTMSDGYNPFVYIYPERGGYEERVLTLIETIIINTDGGEKKGGSDPFWDKGERLFLQAIFFFAVDGFVPEERNMNTVLSLIGMLQIAEDDDNYDSDLDYFAKIFEREHGSEHIGVQQFKEFRQKASGKTAKSIAISAIARLAPFRTSAVRRIFSYDSMELDRVGEEKMAIFVVVPPTDKAFNFIAGMLFTQLFQQVQYCATQVHKHDGQRLPIPCRFILDEFANTCTIPNFVQILAYARSFGVGIVPILQSLEQIKNMYKDEWGVIVDNCNSLLYLGSITHMDTLEYMSKLLGKGTFDKRTTGRTRGRQGSSSENFDVVGRELMDASEIRKLEKKDCLLVVGGRNPFYSEKYNYETHPNYRYTSDGNHAYSYSYSPQMPKIIENSVPHGEEEMQDILIPSNINIELAEIEENPQTVLSQLSKGFQNFEPIPDDELTEVDGEESLTDEQAQELFNALFESDEENEQKAMGMRAVSEKTKLYFESLEKDVIRILENPLVLVNMMGRVCRRFEPIPDDELIVDDGEASEEESVEHFIESESFAIEDSDTLSDIEHDIFYEMENLTSLIENDPAFLEQIEHME